MGKSDEAGGETRKRFGPAPPASYCVAVSCRRQSAEAEGEENQQNDIDFPPPPENPSSFLL